MKTKEIICSIAKIIRKKYRFDTDFCKEAGITKQHLDLIIKRSESGKSMILDNVEKLLNTLGYELTIKKKDRKEAV